MGKNVTEKIRCDLACHPVQIRTPVILVTIIHGNNSSDIPKKGNPELRDRQNRIHQICQVLKPPKEELPKQALPKQ